jgi:hypothetical protein
MNLGCQTEEEFLGQISDNKFLKKDSAAWSLTGFGVIAVAGTLARCVLYTSQPGYRFS